MFGNGVEGKMLSIINIRSLAMDWSASLDKLKEFFEVEIRSNAVLPVIVIRL